jgi:isopenicillin N synthase-like dioxygenase
MIPVVDIAPLYASDDRGWQTVSREIDKACREAGFFYVSGHQIPQARIDEVFALGKAFFALPEADKRLIDIARSPNHRGYGPLAAEALEDGFPGDLKETFDMGRNLPPDDPEVLMGLPLHGPNRYPAIVGWQEVMEAHYERMRGLGLLLLKAMATALDCPADFFSRHMQRTVSVLRLIHYPSAEARQSPEQQGCGAHSDYGCITILAQDDVGGLQVRAKNGSWINAAPIPGTFVINIGDLMARWTNDRYVSTLHRVVNPAGCERYSMPFFVEPDFDTTITTIPSCITAATPRKYAPVTSGDWIMSRFAATYAYRNG